MGNPKGSRGRAESPLGSLLPNINASEIKYDAEGVKKSDEVCERKAPLKVCFQSSMQANSSMMPKESKIERKSVKKSCNGY